MAERRLLFLAHTFPPAGGGGVQRSVKFVKYLSRLGWRITVVTTQASLYRTLHGLHDASLLHEIPGDVELCRIESAERPAEPPRGALAPGRIGFERWLASLAPEEIAGGWPEPARSLRRWWWARQAADPSQGWAERVGREFGARGRRWPVILATGSPYSTLLAARALALRWRIPFVADLRDPWCAGNRALGARLFRHQRMEESVLQAAARTIVVTSGMRDLYAEAYPGRAGRLEVIENGVDLDEPWRREPTPPRADRFEVVYTGVLNEERSPEAFFQATRMAGERCSALARRLRIVVAGRIGTTEFLARRHREMALSAGLADRLEERGYLPHDEVVRVQRSAAVLLSIVGGGTHVASGKSFEYVAAGRPILALVPPGSEAVKVLRHAPVVAFPPADAPEAIADDLLDLFSRWERGEFDDLEPRVPEEYTLDFKARQLDPLLATVLDESGRQAERDGRR